MKTIKLSVTPEQYEMYLDYAKTHGHKSLPKLISSMLDETTAPTSRRFSKGLIKALHGNLTPNYVHENDDEKGKTVAQSAGPRVEYCMRGEVAYILHRAQTLGIRFPLIDDDRVCFNSTDDFKPNYVDVTEELDSTENRYLDAWLKDFERMKRLEDLMVYKRRRIGSSISIADYVEVIDQFEAGHDIDPQVEYSKFNSTKKTFKQRMKEEDLTNRLFAMATSGQ